MAKILLVEDDNNLREIYEARLQAEGYTISSAHDGEEALVVAKEQKPDLIISDVMMPKISGFEMLDILRNTDELKDVKVIMLTALGQSDDQQRADRLGADRYLVKSQVTLEDIVKVAQELLSATSEATSPAQTGSEPTAIPAAAPPVSVAPTTAQPETPAVTAPAAGPPATVPSIPPTTPPAQEGTAEATSTEAATVERQIESFVATAPASESEVAPAAEPSVTLPNVTVTGTQPDTPAVPDNIIQPSASVPSGSSTAQVADDKLVSDAVNTFVATTDSADPATPAGSFTIGSVSPQVTPIQQSTPIEPPEATSPQPAEEIAQDVSAAPSRKKIIAPLTDGNAKPDINTLLAKEEAKEGVAPPTPGEAITPAEPVSPPANVPAPAAPDTPSTTPDSPLDPNSIAL
jgi:CheY-like chemotaxis protein